MATLVLVGTLVTVPVGVRVWQLPGGWKGCGAADTQMASYTGSQPKQEPWNGAPQRNVQPSHAHSQQSLAPGVRIGVMVGVGLMVGVSVGGGGHGHSANSVASCAHTASH